jgi:septum formation protein
VISAFRAPRTAIILASGSPRRAELLRAAGIAFEASPPAVDESLRADESPEQYVRRLAVDKAETGARRHPGRVVLGADTTVVFDGEVLGKPVDGADAARMLRTLSGRTHQVITGVAVAGPAGTLEAAAFTEVAIRALTDEEIAQYIASGEPMDKAGAYAIQGRAAAFVTRVDGSYTNVVGLPVALVCRLLMGYPEA